MDQKIGIEFTSTGVDRVVADTRSLNKSLGTVVVTVNSLTTKLATFQSGIGKIAAATKEAAAVMEESASMAARAAQAGERVAASMARSQSYVTRLRRQSAAPIGSGPVTPGGAPVTRNTGAPTSPMLGVGRMGTMMAAYAGFHAAEYVASNALFGKARSEVVDNLRDLSVVGYGKEQLKAIEEQGDKFLRSHWTGGKIKDYLAAATETGSAWDPNRAMFHGKGAEANARMTEAAMLLAATSQSKSTQETAQLLQGVVKAQLQYMPKSESDKYLVTGQKSVADLTAKTAGQLGEVVSAAMVWGPDIKHLVQKAVPTALATGWKFSDLTGMLMALRAGGAGGAQASTAINTMLNKDVLSLAMLQAAGNEDPAVRAMFKSMSAAQQTSFAKTRAKGMQEMFARSPWQMMEQMQGWFKRADAEGWDLHHSMHAGLRSLAVLRPMLSSPAFLEEGRRQAARVAGVKDISAMERRVSLNAGDPGYMEARLENSTSALWRSASKRLGTSTLFESVTHNIDVLTDRLNSPVEISTGEVVSTAVQKLGAAYNDMYGQILTGIGKATGILDKSAASMKATDVLDAAGDKLEGVLGKPAGFAPGGVGVKMSTWEKVASWFGYKPEDLPRTEEEAFAYGERMRKGVADKKQAQDDQQKAFWGPVTDKTVMEPGKEDVGKYVAHWGSKLFEAPFPMAEISGTIQAPETATRPHLPFDGNLNMPEHNITVQPSEVKVESRVFIGEREIRDIVTQVIDRAMRQDGQGFGTGGPGYSYNG